MSNTKDDQVVDLQALIEKDRQERLTLAQAEIAAALRRHRCRLVAQVRITEDGRISAGVILDIE